MFTLIETGFYFLIVFGTFSLVSGQSLNADAAVNWQYGLQDPATPIAEGIIAFSS